MKYKIIKTNKYQIYTKYIPHIHQMDMELNKNIEYGSNESII